ncbi:hypothetical protein AcW1_006491 [Taiwanofungus camphoratus]|nr:hypothetical protein AcV5_009075 [Antrodia cinnamomea]KAI0924348.1 hypothetical protein AcW2_005251 [Antrodia cinnamomea]KAI0940805.1 hypothetical protein AcV7_003085 [Antrodia cinnamomea]KAI0954680.1 hypothetical protein AcW1_006491 [Antrodia cinnamomea]
MVLPRRSEDSTVMLNHLGSQSLVVETLSHWDKKYLVLFPPTGVIYRHKQFKSLPFQYMSGPRSSPVTISGNQFIGRADHLCGSLLSSYQNNFCMISPRPTSSIA